MMTMTGLTMTAMASGVPTPVCGCQTPNSGGDQAKIRCSEYQCSHTITTLAAATRASATAAATTSAPVPDVGRPVCRIDRTRGRGSSVREPVAVTASTVGHVDGAGPLLTDSVRDP